MVENYSKSIEIKKQQLESLEASVEVASNLFQNARVEYIDVLFAQRDLLDARMVLIETKKEQLSAIVNAYQALGGGSYLLPIPIPQSMQSHHWKLLETLKSDRGGRDGSETASSTGGGGTRSGDRFQHRRHQVVRDRFQHRRREVVRYRFQHRRRQVVRNRLPTSGGGKASGTASNTGKRKWVRRRKGAGTVPNGDDPPR